MKLTKIQKKEISKMAKKYGLKLILLFGSFANGKHRQDSDFDIAIMGKGKIDFKNQIKLINSFSQVFKRNIDLSIINCANPLLLFQISKNAKLIYGNEKDFFKFKLYAFHRYNDYAPYFKIEENLNKKFIRKYAAR